MQVLIAIKRNPATIGPAAFTRITPEMSRDEMRENLIAGFERMGLTVNRDK